MHQIVAEKLARRRKGSAWASETAICAPVRDGTERGYTVSTWGGGASGIEMLNMAARSREYACFGTSSFTFGLRVSGSGFTL